MIQEGFRAEYDKVCVGNKPGHPQDIYYEGMLLKEGLGMQSWSLSLTNNRGAVQLLTVCQRPQRILAR